MIIKIKIKWFDQKSSTFAGYVVCKDEFEADKLYSALNQRLIGDTVIQCSWEKKHETYFIVKEPSLPISSLQSGTRSKLSRKPSNAKKSKWTKINGN